MGARATCHQVGFELYASYEHIRPLRVGGTGTLENLVTSSIDINFEKSTQTWTPLFPSGKLEDWDGLIGWFGGSPRERTGHGCRPDLGGAEHYENGDTAPEILLNGATSLMPGFLTESHHKQPRLFPRPGQPGNLRYRRPQR